MAQYNRNARPNRSSSNSSSSSSSRQQSGSNSNYSSNRNNSRYNGGSNNNRSSNNGRSRYGNNNNRSRGRGNQGGGRAKPQVRDKSLFVNDLQNEVAAEQNAYTGKPYSDFKFSERVASNLVAKGYEVTTEIQEKAIPMIMDGRDVLGISATGSGKTGAFLIPMIEKLLKDRSQKLFIVAPTRELAIQIAKEAISLLRGTYLNLTTVIGGENINRQIQQLKRGGHVIVGTPGRLKDLIQRGNIYAEQYNNVVIDEVDRMLDMGFIKDIRFILGKVGQERQTLFFSATLNKKVQSIVDSISSDYNLIKLAGNTPTKSVVQSIIDFTHNEEKISILEDILNKEEVEKAIVFVDTKRYADKIDKLLHQGGFKVGVIHGDKRQNVRKRMIDMFKRSKIDILVATNVAARGIDIDDITHVINLDEPQTYDEYIHRIGRTGRNGSFGTAYTFVKRGQ